jgi:CBS domain-containing protein
VADTQVRDVMTHLVVMLYPNDTIHEAAQKLARNHISGAPVVEDGKVVGIVSESDLIRELLPPAPVDHGANLLDAISILGRAHTRPHKHGKTVLDVMTHAAIKVMPTTSIWKAASIMERKGIKRLPIVDDEGYLLGIVSRADLVKAFARSDDQIRDEIIDSIRVLGEETIADLDVEVDEGITTLKGVADRKTTHELAVKVAARTPGVVELIDVMTYERDDTKIKFGTNPDPDPRHNWRPKSGVNEGVR